MSAVGGSTGMNAILGVGIKEYMNVPWMPVVDIEAEPTGNSLDPTSDRREQSGRGFTNGAKTSAAGNSNNNKTSDASIGNSTTTDRPTDSPVAVEEDQFPYDEVVATTVSKIGNGTVGEIREPVLRPKSRFRMYRMPDGSASGNSTLQSLPLPQINGSNASSPATVAAGSTDRSFIVHLLPQRLMNMIEQAEKYARMAFSPFMWPTKERTQRALKQFPRSVECDIITTES